MAESSRGLTMPRWISILFHPVPVMVAASLAATDSAPAALKWQVLVVVAAAAAVLMAYSAARARSGRWRHVDASERHERAELNRFASWLFFGLAAALAVAGAHRDAVAAVALAGVIVLASHLLGAWLKSSLHVAFVAYAACIAWPHALAWVLVAALPAVAWSRHWLGRHVGAELLSGALLGFSAGAAVLVTRLA